MSTKTLAALTLAFFSLSLAGCNTAVGHRAKLAKDGLMMRLRGKKPSNEYRARMNPERNLDSEQNKRLFLYQYYPDYYESATGRDERASGSPQGDVPPMPTPMPQSMQAPYLGQPYGMPQDDMFTAD